MTATSFQIETNWNDDSRDGGFSGDSMRQVWTLTELDKLCFTCELPKCKEDSVKCPINVAKASAKNSK